MGLDIFVQAGGALLAALVVGAAVRKLHLPKVTGYLVAGILFGPSLVGMLSEPGIHDLTLIKQLALGLIFFNLGREFRSKTFRKLGRPALVTGLCIAGTTLAVTLAALLVAGANTQVAWILALIAVTTSPAAVLLVVRDYEAEGPFTDMLLAVVVLCDVIALVLFRVTLPLCTGEHLNVLVGLGGVAGSVLMGIVLGLLLSAFEQWTTRSGERIAVTLGMLLAGMGIAGKLAAFQFDPLILAMSYGVTFANATTKDEQLFGHLKFIEVPLYALFFVLAGAGMKFGLVKECGVLVFVMIGGRIVGLVAGAWVGTRAAGQRREIRTYLRLGLLPCAGAAIGLAGMAGPALGGGVGRQVMVMALTSVAFFELLGPLAVKFAILRVGEVKLISLVTEHGALQALKSTVAQVRRALGIPVYHKLPIEHVTARHVMRTHVETISHDAPLPEIIRVMAHSRYDLFPVVDREARFVGGIYLSDIRSVVFDPAIATLVIARDLASFNFPVVYEEDSLNDVLQKFASQPGQLHNLPVLHTQDDTHLIGIINQREVLDAVHLVERARRKRKAYSTRSNP